MLASIFVIIKSAPYILVKKSTHWCAKLLPRALHSYGARIKMAYCECVPKAEARVVIPE